MDKTQNKEEENMLFWLKNGLLGWVILSALWGALTIIYDILIESITGNEYTISAQTQAVSVENPVIPAAIGLVVGALACHFFKVREWGWFNTSQPWLYYALGFAAGVVIVAFTWTQRV
jgi:hypothetical protein